MKTYIVIIEGAKRTDIIKCMFNTCLGICKYVPLTDHSFLLRCNSDFRMLRNCIVAELGGKAQIFVTESNGNAAWNNLLTDGDSIKQQYSLEKEVSY